MNFFRKNIRNYVRNPFLIFLLRIFDYILIIPIIITTPFFYLFARLGPKRLPRSRQFIKKFGVFPIRNHYYAPLFDDSKLKNSLSIPRKLPGINLNIEKQLNFIKKLDYRNELLELRLKNKSKNISDFTLGNGAFESGDAEFLYSIIRFLKPSKVIEVGSGYSTKIANKALIKNFREDSQKFEHICIEPYEMEWLEELNISVKRELIEEVDIGLIEKLQKNDLLFIDSSHVIRPQGDVLKIYLEIIPKLKSGVIVHVHDIFTPRDYLDEWVRQDVKFWNEQYLLEALISNDSKYEILAALNFIHHSRFEALNYICPYLSKDREPGSFYFRIK